MTFCCDSVRRARPLLGAFVEISARGADGVDLHAAIDASFAAIETVHRLMSFQERASELSLLNELGRDAVAALHPWTRIVLAAAAEFREQSGGAFNAAVGPGGRIDLSGIAKGFAVDKAVEALRSAGVENGVVNAGGDLVIFGDDAREVEVRDPADPSRILGTMMIHNSALASSGRVVDPQTGRFVQSIIGSSVRAPTCMAADALTKVVGVLGEGAVSVLRHYGASAILFREESAVFLAA
jgi:thiamine biosynthesis lipoprotein